NAGAAITSTPSAPRATPTDAAREIRSRIQQAASGATQMAVEKARIDARPGGSCVRAEPVSAEYIAICNTPDTVIKRQSEGGGHVSSPRIAATANSNAAAIT